MPAMFLRIPLATLLGGCCLSLCAQAHRSTAGELDTPQVQVYAGYSYWHPIGAKINNIPYPDVKYGAEGSVTYFLNSWLGVTGQGGTHVDDVKGVEWTTGLGLHVQTSAHRFTPFLHVLGGITYLGGPARNGRQYGWNGTAGVGLDWVPTYRHDWLAVRLFQGDYQYNHIDYGPLLPPGDAGGIAHNNTLSASTGLVFRFGGHHRTEMAAQMSCSANKVEVDEGDPVTVTGQVLGFDAMKPMQFTWTTSGGLLRGQGSDTASIDTSGLAAGDYHVTGTVVQGKHRSAQCSAPFTIRKPLPPTLSCSASPVSIAPGETAMITARGMSPENRPLTYAFNASSGRLMVDGNTAKLTSTLGKENITVSCNVRDDRGLSASDNATVTVTMAAAYRQGDPNLSPLPLQNDLCAVSFARDRRRPARVDNEGKACLDGVALSLERQQDATLVVLGDHTARESVALAAERAVNVKLYLTQEKGIDPSRIQVRAKDGGEAQVQPVYLAAGATFNEEGRVVNERAVVHHGEAYGRPGAAASRSRTRRRRAVKKTPPAETAAP